MSRRANFMKIGLFVLTATAVLIGALVLFGLRESFKPGVIIESCFDQSVQGLSVGSDVKFRGVKIGTVQEIGLVAAAYPDAPSTYSTWVLVRAKVDTQFFRLNHIDDIPEALNVEIDKGMRAYLSPQGITGLVFLEMDYEVAKQDDVDSTTTTKILIRPTWDVAEGHLYIPAGAGFIKSFMDSTQSIATSMDRFMNEDFPRISDETLAAIQQANGTMADVREYIRKPELAAIPARVDALLKNLEQLTNEDEQASVTRLLRSAEEITSATLAVVRDPEVRGSVSEMRALLTDTRAVAATLNRELPDTTGALRATLDRIDYLIASQQQGLVDVTTELRQILRNLEEMTSNLKDDPSLIIFSAQPRPVEPAK